MNVFEDFTRSVPLTPKMSEMYDSLKKTTLKTKPAEIDEDVLMGLDLSSQGIKNISKSLFDFTFIKVLNVSNNGINIIPREMWKLKNLEVLNLSKNKIRSIPPELGRIVSLRELNVSDNLISNIPMEMGSLYNMEVFDISNNPLIAPFNVLAKDKKLLQFCREHNTGYAPPNDRFWVDCCGRDVLHCDIVSVGTFNILSNACASKLAYTPSWVINPEFRKEGILQEITQHNVDILCLQEIELYSLSDFYKDQLEIRCGYDFAVCPKGKIKNVSDKRSVDSCTIFWRKGKFRLVNQISIDFHQKMSQDTRFNTNQRLLDRYGNKDQVAIAVILEKQNGRQILVVSTHIFWNPEYPDVKLFQLLLLIEEIDRIRERYNDIPLLLLGDFNSLKESSVYRTVVGSVFDVADFGSDECYSTCKEYGHGLCLKDSYADQELEFTNFTPDFKGVIDYIFYSNELSLVSVLSSIESDYTESVVGLPSIHFPSDHLFLGAKFVISSRAFCTATSKC